MKEDELVLKTVAYGRKFSADNLNPQITQGKFEPEELYLEAQILEGQNPDEVLVLLHAKAMKMRRALISLRDKFREIKAIQSEMENLTYEIEHAEAEMKKAPDTEKLSKLKTDLQNRMDEIEALRKEVATTEADLNEPE